MALLPNQILPEAYSFGKVQPDGRVRIDHNWYLFLFNVAQQSIGNGQSAAVVTIPVGASPFTYQPTSGGVVVIEGGTVTGITVTRAGVTASLNVLRGQIALKALDSVTVTYAYPGGGTGKYNSLTPQAPTMQFWPI